MIDVTVYLYADVIKNWIIEFKILPGVQRDADRRGDTLETHTAAARSDTGTNRLQHENDTIGAVGIKATEIYIKNKIERIVEIDLIGVPDAAELIVQGLRERVAVA
ncbi:MAG: hypothetical protein E6H09_22775 [Bacteroidetes bacterium]|nr:MAG: hypothetical protein E6H09_22775 [Bacteroidota bacterium]